VSDTASAAEIFFSILAVRTASETISLFEVGGAGQSAEMRFSVAVPADMAPADIGLVIDAERAEVFYTTVSGTDFPHDSRQQPADTMSRPGFWRSRGRLSAGRMICLLKQQLNL
jgi:hypothetical protein